MNDEALIAAYRAGDDAAFGRIHERHHAALERYARKILGRSSEHAEDVVQEAMLRASRALRRDDRHIELQARGCTGSPATPRSTSSPASAPTRSIWRTPRSGARCAPPSRPSRRRCWSGAATSATCSATSRRSPPSSATRWCGARSTASRTPRSPTELGVTPQATKNLVHRARTNLVKQRNARSVDCQGVRADLLEAHDEGRRASAASYRHLATCSDCRAFRAGLRDTRKAAAMLMPVPLVVIAFGLLTGKAVAATAKGAMVKGAATAAAGVAITAGAVGVGVQVFTAGDPAPQSATSRALPVGLGGEGRRAAEGHRDRAAHGVAHRRGRDDRARLPGRAAGGGPDRRPRGERVVRAGHGGRHQPQRAGGGRAADRVPGPGR